MNFIPLCVPNLSDEESVMVNRALASGYVSSVGPDVAEFEAAVSSIVGVKHAVACSSGTAALHVALRLVGVRPGDEVLCADFTFAGSANPIAYLHAVPVFIDSEWRTWGIDPVLVVDELERRAANGEKQPAAVEVVHILGQPVDLAPILDACDRYGVPIVEDAAESLGATWSGGRLAGRHTGSVGTIGCFSFNGNKIVTTGGGGMIVTDRDDLAEQARHLTTQAKVPAVGYLHDTVGYNYRLTNLSAALGIAQLSRLREFVNAKHRIAETYDEGLRDLQLQGPPRVEGFGSTYWLYSVLVEDCERRDALLEHLNSEGIGARALWRPMHSQPSFAGSRVVDRGVGSALFLRGISLPSSTHLTADEQARVIEVVRAFYTKAT